MHPLARNLRALTVSALALTAVTVAAAAAAHTTRDGGTPTSTTVQAAADSLIWD